MRASVAVVFLLLNAFLTSGYEDLDALVAKTLHEAAKFHYGDLLNATMRGAQSLAPSKCPFAVKSSPFTEEMSRISNIYKRALDVLVDEQKLERSLVMESLTRQLPAACQQPNANCNPNSRYRTFDGTCNNVLNPFWGAINQPMVRIVASAYEDRFDVPRGGRQSSRLPNARVVSTTIHPDSILNHPSITNMVPQFGQFLDHDMSSTPEGGRMCCSGASDPDCWPITVPFNDPFYSRVSRPQSCIDFTRSTAYCFSTNSGVREQMNMNTAFIDGSQVYGSNPTRAQQLRQLSGGRMRTNSQLTGFLPATSQVNSGLQATVGSFIAGDDRINEMPALTVMHNLFLMEHNRIADQIRALRPAFSDETIYQEARKIVSAELQQVTYNEYLPLVLGAASMTQYNLYLGNQYSTYNANLNPTIINSFATAAYRFGHSLVNGLVRLVSNGNVLGSYLVRDNYGQSQQFTQSNGQGYDWILGGLMTQNSQQFDPFVTVDMTNFLFKMPNSDFGSDLVARNIQRGRDHGLAPYSAFRSACGLSPLSSSWGVKPAEVRADSWSRLQSLYATPLEIDLFTGGLVETPVANGLSGPTFNCIKSVQFQRSKFGDRYFFTHGSQPGSFTTTQIAQLRARTLGDIICENSQQVQTTANVFLVPSTSNPSIACNSASRNRLNIANFV